MQVAAERYCPIKIGLNSLLKLILVNHFGLLMFLTFVNNVANLATFRVPFPELFYFSG